MQNVIRLGKIIFSTEYAEGPHEKMQCQMADKIPSWSKQQWYFACLLLLGSPKHFSKDPNLPILADDQCFYLGFVPSILLG